MLLSTKYYFFSYSNEATFGYPWLQWLAMQCDDFRLRHLMFIPPMN